MADNHAGIGKKKESIFLSEIFMGAVCLLFAVAGLVFIVTYIPLMMKFYRVYKES